MFCLSSFIMGAYHVFFIYLLFVYLFTSIQLHSYIRLVNTQKVMYTIKSVYKQYSSNTLIEDKRIQYFNVRYCSYA